MKKDIEIRDTGVPNEFLVSKNGRYLGKFVTKNGKSDIAAMVDRMENPPVKTVDYKERRRAEYPAIGDQLDAEFKARQRCRMTLGKAKKLLDSGDVNAALLCLIDAMNPIDEQNIMDAKIMSVKTEHKKE